MKKVTNHAHEIASAYHNDITFLKKVVDEYPVSSFANFLHLYELKRTGSDGLALEIAKTALYFCNPLWLQYQLVLPVPATDERLSDVEEEDLELFEDESGVEEVQEDPDEEMIDMTTGETKTVEDKADEGLTDSSSPVDPAEVTHPDISANRIQEEQNAVAEQEKEQAVELVEGPQLAGDREKIEEVFAAGESGETRNESANALLEEENAAVEDPTLLQEHADVNTHPIGQESAGIDTAPAEQKPEEEEATSAKPEDAAIEAASAKQNDEQIDDSIDQKQHQPAIKPMEGNEPENIPFEPLHTIDYFASQGITIKESALADDKLSNQVKSFTAWLKTMKSLHPGKLPEQNEVVERIIQTSAEESNHQTDVLTEAMAEVLVKQNKHEKAIEMYEKLSLMNPAKSTYFAAKIESIKHSNI